MDFAKNSWISAALRYALMAATACSTGTASASGAFFGAEAGYRSGAFGSTVTSTLSSVTLSLGGYTQDYDYSVSVPVLRLEDELGASESGLGDVILRAGRSNVYSGGDGLAVDASVSVKIPTADEAKGLGTGETDFGGFLNLRKQWSDVVASLGVGYVVVGDTADTDYRDVTSFSVGLLKHLSRGGVLVSVEQRSASIEGTDDPREIGLGGYYVLNGSHAFSGGVFKGLSDGSADYGANIGWLTHF